MTTETKCPNCGAEAFTSNAAVTEFHCGSTLYSESFVCRNSGFERFNPSHLCELATLRASLAKAVEALKPFADMVPRSHMSVPDETEVTWETEYWNGPSKWAENWPAATVGDLRRASAVLKEISKDL